MKKSMLIIMLLAGTLLSHGSRESDSLVLVAIQETNPHVDFTWSGDNPLDEWRFITFSDNRVTGLYFRDSVSLPGDVENLDALRYLHFTGTKLTALPPVITKLSSLDSLVFTGNKLSQFPTELYQLSQLKLLYLNNNGLTDIPDDISRLENLEEISLSSNKITELPSSLGDLSKLESLDLSANRLITLPKELANLNSLNKLDIQSNQIATLPDELVDLTITDYLGVRFNQLHEENLSEKIISWLNETYSPWRDTQRPYMAGNLREDSLALVAFNEANEWLKWDVSRPVSEWRGVFLSEFGRVEMLNFSSTTSERKRFIIPAEVEKLQALKWFRISGANIIMIGEYYKSYVPSYGFTIESIPQELCELSQLNILEISNTTVGELPESIGNLENLTDIDFSFMKTNTLPSSLGDLPHLKNFNIFFALFETLPESVTNLTSLSTLRTEFNCLDERTLSPGLVSWLNGNNSGWQEYQILSGEQGIDGGEDLSTNDISYTVSSDKIEFSRVLSKRAEVSLFDVKGRELISESISGNIVNLPKLSSGIYILKIHSDQLNHLGKISIGE